MPTYHDSPSRASVHPGSYAQASLAIANDQAKDTGFAGCSKSLLSKAVANGSTGGVAPGYVEDAFEARTMLAEFFSILPENYLRVRTDWSAKLTRGLGKRPNNITPATAQANTKERVGEVTRRGGATEEGLGSRIYITMTTLI